MNRCFLLSFYLVLFTISAPLFARDVKPSNIANKTITLTVPDKTLSITIDYSAGCIIKELKIKGKNVLSSSGIYTGISTKSGVFSSDRATDIKLVKDKGTIRLSGIKYGDASININETWEFRVAKDQIHWSIKRTYDTDAELTDIALPKYNFVNMSVWKGGILDNGGMVWCKYLSRVNDTYGVHTGGVTFWNAESGDGLRISTSTDADHKVATKYSHSANNEFTCNQYITDAELGMGHNLSRFISRKNDIFAPFLAKKGIISAEIDLKYIDYFKTYTRGTLPGIDAVAVRELLNTTGRYGVVDNNIVGANGWLTNWKCLHEPFFAQIGMAVDDKNYTKNMSATLNQERDLATLPDGRVLSRWHNAAGDEIPGTYNAKTGYYEAMWGYTIDSQTGYVINASEQFDLNGDVAWLKSHQQSCEQALDWLIKRDANHNGIFEMMNNNVAEKKGSDWLDIVWASYENAFVNAQMYEALNLWANCEKVLGNNEKSAYYTTVAGRLKTAFNKPISEGGFWSAEKRQYVYWRDNDGSVHGDNLVTPVNFAAIAFGICDDKARIAQVLDQIEQRASAENLFHWPLCFDSFKQAEVQAGGNWPFPKYENGDIFPTWGYLGIRAYANYNKTIALKYISNILKQYKKDGLSSQRYSRVTQLGQGEDVLSGISTTITALYRDLYGIRPKWNRMGIEPNMSPALNGTKFSYVLRDKTYQLSLSLNDYTMATDGFTIKSKEAFGANKIGKVLTFYQDNKEDLQVQISSKSNQQISLIITSYMPEYCDWTMPKPGNYQFKITGLKPLSDYALIINRSVQKVETNAAGSVTFKKNCTAATKFKLEGKVGYAL